MQILFGKRNFFVVLTRLAAGLLGTSFMLAFKFVRFSNKHLALITYMCVIPSMAQAKFLAFSIRCGAMEFLELVVVVVVVIFRFAFPLAFDYKLLELHYLWICAGTFIRTRRSDIL